MLLQLQNFDIEVVHVSGKNIPVADTLSRNFVEDTYSELTEGLDVHIHTVLKSLPVSDNKLQQVRTATQNDSQFQVLKQVILDGWPDARSDCPATVLEFWNHRDEMSVGDGIIFRGQKLVIPKTLRQEMIDAVHIGHMGVNKTVSRARDIMFWPLMTKDITDHVLACHLCLTHRHANPKQPLKPHDVPQRPWQHIACDLFALDGKDYLITADYYSKHFEIDWLPDTKSITVIRKLKVHFSRLGLVDSLKSDNGPQFSSDEFAKFASEWNFTHVTSSPGYSQSNGFIEKMVSVGKGILKKSKASKTDPYLPMLEYRNTPLDCGYSPAQLLMGRRLKSILPTTEKQLQPQMINHQAAIQKMQNSKTVQKQYYDQGSKTLPFLNVGDSCRVQMGKIWKQAVVIEMHGERSFLIKTDDGAILRRNRRFLHKTREKSPHFNHDEFMPTVLQQQNPNKISNQQTPVKPVDSPIMEQPRSNHSQNSPKVHCQSPHKDQSQECNNTPYRTRSGREVKPNKLFNDNQWIK
jgi:transposase InsO family protein